MTRTHRITALLLCCLGLAVVDAKAEEIGVHLNSVHMPSKDHHNNVNRGLYVRGESYQAGFYVNSINRFAPYAAYVHKVGPVGLLIGMAGGYQRKCTVSTKQVGEKLVVTKNDDGIVKTTYPILESREDCRGFSRGYLTPMAGLSIKSPVSVLGATPVLFVAPGFGKAASVASVAIQFKF